MAGRRQKSAWSRLGLWLWTAAIVVLTLAVPVPILLILLFRFVPVPATPQMMLQVLEGEPANEVWAGDDISPYLGRAVIASEDQRFCSHNGFDWVSINQALNAHEQGARLRGA